MAEMNDYLEMQKAQYESRAGVAKIQPNGWILDEAVVGSYQQQEQFPYIVNIMEGIQEGSKDKTILEYGCGPGRNLLRLSKLFKVAIGVDISQANLENARKICDIKNIKNIILHKCDGKSVPLSNNSVDHAFSVICMQHICSYNIRRKILEELYRVLKPFGWLVCQFGFNDPDTIPAHYVGYYANKYDATDTNGACDCCVTDQVQLIRDLKSIGFNKTYVWHTHWVNDSNHTNWIWIRGQK
jgi:ubiquinone/menaquinone biosynthesis C-methylase UbiE